MIAGYLGIDVINAGRRWAYARARLRLLLDSKAATPQQVQKAKTDYNRLTNEMEVMVGRLERAMQQEGVQVAPVKRSQPAAISLKQVLGFVADAAKAAEVAIQTPLATDPRRRPPTRTSPAKGDDYINAEIIDTDGEST